MTLSIGKLGDPSIQEIDVHAIIPYGARSLESGLADKLRLQVIASTEQVGQLMGNLPEEVGDSLFRERCELVTQYLTKLGQSLSRSSNMRRFSFNDVLYNLETADKEIRLVESSTSDRDDRHHLNSIIRALDGFRGLVEELRNIVSETLPVMGQIQFLIAGSRVEVEELGKRLRERAVEIVREKQQSEADDNGWKTVSNEAGDPILYHAPLGSSLPPAHPIVNIDSAESAQRVLSHLEISLDRIEFPRNSGVRDYEEEQFEGDDLSEFLDEELGIDEDED